MKAADFASFYEAEREGLVRFAATIVGPDRAEDVVANAVVSVMKRVLDPHRPTKVRPIETLRPYVYRAVSNAAAKDWRTISRRDRREAYVAQLSRSDQAGAPLVDDDVARAIAELSPRQRAVIHLTYWEDLTPMAVARRLKISEGAVRRHLARARQSLRRRLQATSEVGPNLIKPASPGQEAS